MRETLSKGHKGKRKSKVASARVSSKLVSKKKKELKKRPATSQTAAGSSRATSRLKQRKSSPTKIAGKVTKNSRIKKTVKKVTKASVKKTTPKASSKSARAEKKIVVKSQKKVVEKKRIKNKSLNGLPMIVPQAPPPSESPRRQSASSALRDFEQGVNVFNRRRFEDAKTMFESVLAKHPGDLEIVARAQMYLQVCKQKTEGEPRSVALPNADELYDQGVFALNIGDFTQARVFFENALSLRPDEPHLLYSLAATHAQTGAHEEALDYLKRSIQVQPRFRAQAYNDADFSELRDNRRFLQLVGLTSPFDLLESKR